MMYTFHNETETPRKVPGSERWNCSVPFWATFERHFPCDMEVDCDGEQDEVVCPYYTPVCGGGKFVAGDLCVFFREVPGLYVG